jgi:hypothetical protein
MSQAGRDEWPNIPRRDPQQQRQKEQSRHGQSKITPNLIPWIMRRRSDHDPCPAASIKAPTLMCRCHAQNEEREMIIGYAPFQQTAKPSMLNKARYRLRALSGSTHKV